MSSTPAPPPSSSETPPAPPSSSSESPQPPPSSSSSSDTPPPPSSQSSETPNPTPSSAAPPPPSQTTGPLSTPPPQSSSLPTSQTVQSTQVVLTSGGLVYTTIVPTTIAAPASSDTGGSSSSSKTGPIVGGVVGGVALLLILLFAGIWAWRKHKRDKEQSAFDGNFDPAKFVATPGGGTLPDIHVDDDDDTRTDGLGGRLAGSEVGGGVVTPYPYAQNQYPGYPEMHQHSNIAPSGAMGAYRGQGSPPPGSTDFGYQPSSPPHSASSHGQAHAQYNYANPNLYPSPQLAPVGVTVPMPTPMPSGSSYQGPASASSVSGSGDIRSAKEREAFPQRRIANPDGETYPPMTGQDRISVYSEEAHQAYLASGPSNRLSQSYGVVPSSSQDNPYIGPSSSQHQTGKDVLVHTDGGRVPEASQQQDEIPPTYDSIPGNVGSSSNAALEAARRPEKSGLH